MPGINDDPRQVQKIVTLAAEAGATNIGGIGLHLRGEVREVFLDWLRSARPDLVEHYDELYARGAYAPRRERLRLVGLIERARQAHPEAFVGPDLFRDRNADGSMRRPVGGNGASARRPGGGRPPVPGNMAPPRPGTSGATPTRPPVAIPETLF